VVDAAASAEATVVGVVGEIARLDERAWISDLVVERGLDGPHAAGARVTFAWDERMRDRPLRFAPGDRVLVCLEPLPGWSIWRRRLGDREAVGIARRGEAWVADPEPATVEALARWLALPAGERRSAPGVSPLAAMVREAQTPIALGAVDALAHIPGLAGALDAAARDALRAALADPGRPDALRAALLDLARRRGLEALRPEIEALAASGSATAPAAVAAWAALPGGLPTASADALLETSLPPVRAAVLREAPMAPSDAALEAHLGADPDAEVRAAAVGAFVARHGMEAWPRVAPLLDDPNVPEGAAAARALGGLGEPAVPRLLERALARPLDGARGPLLALRVAAGAGAPALVRLSREHEDPSVRAFASFLLGRPPPEH
jgi:hypothetical protein